VKTARGRVEARDKMLAIAGCVDRIRKCKDVGDTRLIEVAGTHVRGNLRRVLIAATGGDIAVHVRPSGSWSMARHIRLGEPARAMTLMKTATR